MQRSESPENYNLFEPEHPEKNPDANLANSSFANLRGKRVGRNRIQARPGSKPYKEKMLDDFSYLSHPTGSLETPAASEPSEIITKQEIKDTRPRWVQTLEAQIKSKTPCKHEPDFPMGCYRCQGILTAVFSASGHNITLPDVKKAAEPLFKKYPEKYGTY